jgi:hypothetical protein
MGCCVAALLDGGATGSVEATKTARSNESGATQWFRMVVFPLVRARFSPQGMKAIFIADRSARLNGLLEK